MLSDDFLLYIFSVVVAVIGGYLLGKLRKPVGLTIRKDSDVRERKYSEGDDGKKPATLRALSLLGQAESQASEKKKRRVVIVAHSLPIRISRPKSSSEKWSVAFDDSRNWLAAMRMLEEKDEGDYSVSWVGCVDAFGKSEDEKKSIKEELEKLGCVPVWIETRKLRETYFIGCCKSVLWRLFHYVMPQADPDFGEAWDERWQAYQTVNALIGKTVCDLIGPQNSSETSIWIHGYQLLLVPGAVRSKLPLAKIGVFIHTPWPTTDVVRCLPSRENLLNELLCADVIGFHTYDYARHFLSGCRRILGLDFQAVAGGRLGVKTENGRTVLIIISHLGINSKFFQELAGTPEIIARSEKIREDYKGRQVVIGIDHLDLVKGTIVKLHAYERFLEAHEEWKDRVTLIQVLLKSWNSENEQKRIRKSVMSVVERIEKRFGKECIKVLDGSSTELGVNEAVAIYCSADAALISTFWDGLNLAPYEFTASQKVERPGVLILSEFMGCARSLSGALRVNPWNLEDVSEKLNIALSMPLSTRIANHKRRIAYVMRHTTHWWAKNFLSELETAKSLQNDLSFVHLERKAGEGKIIGMRRNSRYLTMGADSPLPNALKGSRGRIFFLDYDGTLISEGKFQLVDNDAAAKSYTRRCSPSSRLLNLLQKLTSDRRNLVFIVSGRKRGQLHEWFRSIPELGIAAEKGFFIKWPKRLAKERKVSVNDQGFESMLGEEEIHWKEDVLRLLKAYTERTDGSYIEEKEVSLSWHFDAADPVFGQNQAGELHRYIEKIVSESTVDITRYRNHKILEVKPKGVDKGSTIVKILTELLNTKALPVGDPLVLAAGDEASDELMFLALNVAAGTTDKSNLRGKRIKLRLEAERTLTCCVGVRPSEALYYVDSQRDMINLLEAIAAAQ
mmetsp:Transcript_14574/g.22116  ORF Transcript_14574/g.22116 Transcript_14574/m.22116 type:complete len:903 (+) Transcript_14574:85-2793(+)